MRIPTTTRAIKAATRNIQALLFVGVVSSWVDLDIMIFSVIVQSVLDLDRVGPTKIFCPRYYGGALTSANAVPNKPYGTPGVKHTCTAHTMHVRVRGKPLSPMRF